MGVPENFHGKKGRSGRKSAYEEKTRAKLLADAFFSMDNYEDLRKKYNKEALTLWEQMIYDAHSGNDKYLTEMFKKLFPDKVEQKDIPNEEMEEVRLLLKDRINEIRQRDKFIQDSEQTSSSDTESGEDSE